MIRNVIENYLTSLNELPFFLPFHQLLEAKGFFDIHITHSQVEFGKDIIAKKSENGINVQYIFQIKAGDINLDKFRSEVKTQLLNCITNQLSHPNLSTDIERKIVFVTTGILNSHAALDFQEFNKFIVTKLKEKIIKIWDKENLIIDFKEIGIKPFFSIHNSPEIIGSFFLFYAKLKNNSFLYFYDITDYTKSWLTLDWTIVQNRLHVFFEAYLFSELLLSQNRFYEASLFISALIRTLIKNKSYDYFRETIEEYLKEIIINFSSITEKLLKQENALTDYSKSTFSIFYYPINCHRCLELFSLYILTIDENNDDIKNNLKNLLNNEPGCFKPISDNYAISIALTSFALLKIDEIEVLKKFLNNVTTWICDRYEENGLSSIGSTLEREIEQLLSENLEGFAYNNRNSSFVANCVLDMCFILNDDDLFANIANDLKATEIILEFFHVVNDESLYSYENESIYKEFDHEFSLSLKDDYSKIITYEKLNQAITLKDRYLFFLMFLLRDRYFPTFVRELL